MRPSLDWSTRVDRDALRASGHDVVEFSALRREVVAPARSSSARRKTIANPAQAWLDRVARAGRLAVVGVRIRELDDLVVLHGYVLEPALRSPTALVVESDQRLTRLAPERFVDPQFAYPYTLERAIDAATRLFRGPSEGTTADSAPPSRPTRLDAEQRRAVAAHNGVVQVIAPAGSGKTAVLVERVRELLRRGVPAERILCTTFNRDARVELRERLRAAGVHSVEARTFHGTGWWLMREEGLTRRGGVRDASLGQWRRLCAIALRETGQWVDPADARAAISAIKLGSLATADEFRRDGAAEGPDGKALALIYASYERQLVEAGVHDFDDLILTAVRALRADHELRRRWQGRFAHVLVDEYQDIEPAQELLVRILAAPQDGLFCVGDEDQTLYGWRRASVRRIIELDLAYPGLQRISLAHNYRCPPDIVDASRRLIELNRIRFPKPIQAASAAGRGPALALSTHASQLRGAAEIASALTARRRGETVVLARTTNLLRTVALECAAAGVRISAPEQVFQPAGARGAVEAYVRLCAAPERAQAQDVAQVCRAPGRGLPLDAEESVAAGLRAGRSFTEAFAALVVSGRQRARLDEGGLILDALVAFSDAGRFIRYLRGPGGLDQYFGEHERVFAGTERIELEVLEQATREAAGKTLADYAALLEARSAALAAVRDDARGIELTTIHRAKGREWPEVHVFGCEESQLPHARSLEVSDAERAAGEGLEAERRLAYVAFTRAQQGLVVHTTEGAASRFLVEAGLVPSVPVEPAYRAGAAPRRRTSRRWKRTGGKAATRRAGRESAGAEVLAAARSVGLASALRTAESRNAALDGAADALDAGLVGPATRSGRMCVSDLLAAIEQLGERERSALLHSAGIENDKRRLLHLHPRVRRRLVEALRELAG